MIFNFEGKDINTNLAGDSYQKLIDGEWKLGLISDNHGLDDKYSYYYQDYTTKVGEEDNKGRIFKNKVQLKLIDNSIVTKHIIHWVPSEDYFCISEDSFWDQFSD